MNNAQSAMSLLHNDIHFSGEWVPDDQAAKSEVKIHLIEGVRPLIDLRIRDEALCVPHDVQIGGTESHVYK